MSVMKESVNSVFNHTEFFYKYASGITGGKSGNDTALN